jgi:putative transposase
MSTQDAVSRVAPRRHLDEGFHKLAVQKESKVEEGHQMPDHVHMPLSIPRQYAVSQW